MIAVLCIDDSDGRGQPNDNQPTMTSKPTNANDQPMTSNQQCAGNANVCVMANDLTIINDSQCVANDNVIN